MAFTDPLTSRARLAFRPYKNWIIILLSFGGFVSLGSWVSSLVLPGALSLLVVNAVGIGLVFYLHSILADRPIKLRCESCKALILSNTPWACADCDKPNFDTENHPFIGTCKSCGTSQKTYKCHHCSELVFLTEDQDKTSYAYRLNSPAEVPEPDEQVERLKKLRALRELKEEQVEVAKMEENLVQLRKRLKLQKQKKKSAGELLQEGLDSEMEWETAELKKVEELKQQYKDNPTALKRHLKALEKVLLRHLADK